MYAPKPTILSCRVATVEVVSRSLAAQKLSGLIVSWLLGFVFVSSFYVYERVCLYLCICVYIYVCMCV